MDKFNGHVIVFDFDGVLAYNLQFYNGVITTLKNLYNNGLLICLASFNYYAIDIIKFHGIDYVFSAWRCGRSDLTPIKHSLDNETEDSYITNNKIMTKADQIVSMISELFNKNKIPEQEFPSIFTYPKIIFFDDDNGNINDAMNCFDLNCWAINVNPQYGIPKNIFKAIEYIVDYWETNPLVDKKKSNIYESLNEIVND
ncbi:HAD hydrolase [Fadolivirus algeromassiliense]|jgi:hypothetical protein|uniref:HAD hydrolase n=1 Tax=Fadolivirus FV1/VV64 TaxID=3070911 RepID=A0A7D3V5E4_9VIRU|nr:HAD hydrolase [Fadolivirus algeromassiliense]QKF93915.1 HAD hydrolase [Fadolivirus FV1/VV64]